LPPPLSDPPSSTSSSSPDRLVSLPGKVKRCLLSAINLESTNPNLSPFCFGLLVLTSHRPLRRWLLPPLGGSTDALFHGSQLLLSVASVSPSSSAAAWSPTGFSSLLYRGLLFLVLSYCSEQRHPLLLCLPPLPSSSSITVAIAPSSSSISRTHLIVASVTAATHAASSCAFSFAAIAVFDRPSYNSRLLPLLLVPSSPTFVVAALLPLLLLYKLLPPLRRPSLSHLLLLPASPSSSPAAVVAPKCHRDCCPSLLHIATAALSFACSKNYSRSLRRLQPQPSPAIATALSFSLGHSLLPLLRRQLSPPRCISPSPARDRHPRRPQS
ncbi:hypothetical protein BHM03_00046877, partial [Ensete ventricosum]